jgi:CarD family transcriptional regulator
METQVQEHSDTSFQVGDMAVHPAHGVGEVTGIEKRDLGGSVNLFYVLKIKESGLKVMIPVSATAQVPRLPSICNLGIAASGRTPRC